MQTRLVSSLFVVAVIVAVIAIATSAPVWTLYVAAAVLGVAYAVGSMASHGRGGQAAAGPSTPADGSPSRSRSRSTVSG